MKLKYIPLLLALGVSANGCNVFSPLDSPSGDAQLLSAARACFDRGDFSCASENYQKVSADQADTVASEEAFMMLDQAGITMGVYAQFVGDGATGAALTAMAEKLSGDAGQAKRQAIYQAYLKYKAISAANSDLKNFVQFVTSLGLAAEMLAEVAAGGTLSKTSLAQSPSTCNSATPACLVSTGCGEPVSGLLTPATAFGDIDTVDPGSVATVNADMLYSALVHAYNSMLNLAPGGSFSSTSSGIAAIISGGTTPPSTGAGVDRCFRGNILAFGIGR